MKRTVQRRKLELELQTACSQLLELEGWVYLRTDPVSDRASLQEIRARLAAKGLLTEAVAACLRSRGKGFGEVGMADAQYRRYEGIRGSSAHLASAILFGSSETPQAQNWARVRAEMLWIEWKSPDGKPTVEQNLWIAAERKRGALVWVAGTDFPATFEGFKKYYRESGLCRNLSLFR